MNMIRLQLVLPPKMLEHLRSEAKRRGVSVSEVVRSLVQREMDKK